MSETTWDIEGVLERFRDWLHLPDPGVVYAVLGALAANRLDGDPVWLLVVGPPSGGKSEAIGAACGLDWVHPVGTLTEASLLSGTPTKEKAKGAKGGLLREIGDFGVIALKDFGSVLNMHRDARAGTLAALREVFDGSWTRLVGTDGGRTLRWNGKVGLVAGCTPTIDKHHAVMGAMGERFVVFRLGAEDDEQAIRALDYAGREMEMRAELREAVEGLLTSETRTPRSRTPEETERLVALATLVVKARSAVERESYSHEIELVPVSEGPARLVKVLAQLLAGLDAIGADRNIAWRVVNKAALDCIPAPRRAVLEVLEQRHEPISTRDLSVAIELPTSTARRTAEDLTAHRIAERTPQGPGKADLWALTDWARTRLRLAQPSLPSMTDASNNGADPIQAREAKRVGTERE